ncbi:flagellar hook-associated protein FlgK [Oleidesulfovibrio alaskensis G20]|jgi:flagellar hook-associated protein 1 FlgK|uniref:Flagellar hook-associated protein 1 n=1 Tax=Oleidesulfovibrio alaskensis (strain ATCC BAA-1058 / DSM 17464 / G20) TaxID=207559 RepID=Q30WK0_OLEA2|nr:flagellar hook-associated protein FlgK [Oleidesulfovibrio alaskensis]ABB39946.1 flagellar hook-associated protein FlgK [Oleidesulfovibrio alaskensis G20]MBG0774097.1 flagellar hook-associated protein FlgK [Oleidesulfovibrio alaskensis]
MTLNSLLSVGKDALFASQSAIQTTGNNIANVNTPGYSRQAVRFEAKTPIDWKPGQMGTGVKAAEVFRYFNTFIEQEYHDHFATEQRWKAQHQMLQSVESLFNESNSKGINAALSQFFTDWQQLAQRPDDKATREALLAHTQSLTSLINSTADSMNQLEHQMDEYIRQDVDKANKLIKDIAELNRSIQVHDIPGSNNANTLLDQRNQMVRELAAIMDVDVIDRGSGDFVVNTKAGHTLVDGEESFELKFEGPKTSAVVKGVPPFDGEIVFEGSSAREYTLEIVSGGAVGGGATFKVSYDGGRTWLTDETTGLPKEFQANAQTGKVHVDGLDIYFNAGANDLAAGDEFTIVPKSGLYWVRPTTEPLNITPMAFAEGGDNPRRLVGGTLAGYFSFRDANLGKYQEKLDAFSRELAWQVNYLHSQGAGLGHLDYTRGGDSVNDPALALGDASSGLSYFDKLKSGNLTMYFFDSATGELASGASFGPLDFGGGANFDPSVHTLDDVVNAINTSWGGYVTASIADNQLVLDAADGYQFGFADDSTGLLAALGINTYFQGDSAVTLGMRPEVLADVSRINAGRINGGGEANVGDNDTATAISGLATKKLDIPTSYEQGRNQSLSEYFNTISANVGSDTAQAKFGSDFYGTLADDLSARQDSVAGVNLDEEMSSLVKFQHSYKAAAKLVTTADEMLQVLLGLKQ